MAAPGMLSVDTSQFDLARKRAAQDNNTQVQQQKEAIKRRSAQLGGGVSGAMVKQEQLAHEAGAKRVDEANEGINAAERGERARVAEINAGREFQTAEREAGQKFASGEAAKGRAFTTSERMSGQDFASAEALKGREFAAEESREARRFTAQEATKERAFRNRLAEVQQTQFGQQMSLAKAQFDWDKVVDKWNKDMADGILHSQRHTSGGIVGQGWNSLGEKTGWW